VYFILHLLIPKRNMHIWRSCIQSGFSYPG